MGLINYVDGESSKITPKKWDKGGITLRVELTPNWPRNLIFSQFECKWMRLGISWKKSIFLLSGSPTIMHYMGDVKWSNPGFPVWVSAAHQTQNRIFTQKYCLAFWTEWWEINVCGVPESWDFTVWVHLNAFLEQCKNKYFSCAGLPKNVH